MTISGHFTKSIFLSQRLIEAMLTWLDENCSLEIDEKELLEMINLQDLIACMIEGQDKLSFMWRIRDPVFSWGSNLMEAYENVLSSDYDDDEVIFTGEWEEV